MVEDVGVDATGETPIDDAFDSMLRNDTLLVFPEGKYKFNRAHTIANLDRFGIVGRRNARIVPNSVWNGKLFDVMYVSEFLFSGFDIDITHENTTVGFRVACENKFHIEDIEFLGRGIHSDEDVIHALNVGLVNERGRGVIRKLIAEKGSAIDRYKNGDGRGGIYIGPWNKGAITIDDCHLAEFGNNGVYASRTPGTVRVLGGTYRNNNPSSIRISGHGSLVEDALIEVDPSKNTGPPFDGSNSKLRGVVIEQKTEQKEIMKPAGVVMRGCRIVFKENPTSGPPVVVWSNGKTLSIEDCRIHIENNTPAVLREGLAKQGTNPPWRGKRWVRISNTRITGSQATNCAAVRLVDAPESELRNCRIQRFGEGSTGVELVRSTDAVIEGGSVRTGSYPVLINAEDGTENCLVSFVDRPHLQMTGTPGNDSRTSQQATACTPTAASEASGGCCVTWTDLTETGSTNASSIGITGLAGEDMFFYSLQRDG